MENRKARENSTDKIVFTIAAAFIFIFGCGFRLFADIGPVITPNGPAMRACIPYDDFDLTFDSQHKTELCWAASISNIFAFYKHPVSQERIVEAIYGTNNNFPAKAAIDISRAVNRDWIDDNGVAFHSRLVAAYDCQAGVSAINNNYMVNELTHNHPLLVCNTHHCMVITGVDFINFRVLGIIVFDPWPLTDKVHYLSYPESVLANQGGQCMYVGAVRITDSQ